MTRTFRDESRWDEGCSLSESYNWYYDDEWLELLEMNLDEMKVVVYLSRTTGNYDDEWLELLEMNLDEMKVVVYLSRTTGTMMTSD